MMQIWENEKKANEKPEEAMAFDMTTKRELHAKIAKLRKEIWYMDFENAELQLFLINQGEDLKEMEDNLNTAQATEV